MATETQLPELVQALLKPETYPHPVGKIELVQTQMSYIFLTGDYTYKVKKPVNLGYLDYTKLEQRLFFCRQELTLNQRLCPQTYLEVVPIIRGKGNFSLGGTGKAEEYAVKMRQLPRDRTLDVLLRQDKVSPEMMQQVAARVAEFHATAETNPKITAFGDISLITKNTEENFSQTELYVGRSLTEDKYKAITDYTRGFIQKNALLFRKRQEHGKIRDCHGDLHSAHVCFADGICIFDCIEFNDRFRYGDVASEVSFLAMDLDFYDHQSLSRAFVDAYAEKSKDRDLLQLLDFYKCYRAYVRGKVEGFKLGDPHVPPAEKDYVLTRVRRYFDLAFSYTRPRPVLFITAGLVGTGKSTVAQALSEKLGLEVISSDVVRKKLANVPATEHRFEEFESGIYSVDFTQKTYDELFRQAREFLAQRQSVIIDASFKGKADRRKAARLAEDMGADFWAIECRGPEEVVKKRLARRLEGPSVSDGRWEVYQVQKKDFDPVLEVPESNHIVVDASKPLVEIVERIRQRVEAVKQVGGQH